MSNSFYFLFFRERNFVIINRKRRRWKCSFLGRLDRTVNYIYYSASANNLVFYVPIDCARSQIQYKVRVSPCISSASVRTVSTTISTPLDLRASPGGEDSPMSADIQQPVLIQRPVFKMNPAADFWHQARGPPPISPTNNNNNTSSNNNNNPMSTPPPMSHPPQSLLQHVQQQIQQHQQQMQQQAQQHQQQQQLQQQAQQQQQPPPQLQSPQLHSPQHQLQSPPLQDGHHTPNSTPSSGPGPQLPPGPGTPEPPNDGLHSPVGGPSNALALVGDRSINDKLVNDFQVIL